jgi:dihydrofolate synthase/folylpolyglutamate synthase
MFNVSGVAAIARLKAGIFREGVSAVLAEQSAIVSGVLREEAREIGAEVFEARKDWRGKWEGQAFLYAGEKLKVRAPWLGLRGRHQSDNAGAACAALEALGDPRITTEAMSAGLREATWPARLQRLQDGPLTRGFDGEIWIDAAHNPGGAQVLAEAVGGTKGGRTAIVIACQAAKDVEGILSQLIPVCDDLFACPLPDSGGQEGGPGAPPEHIVQIARTLGTDARAALSFEHAIRAAKSSRADRIFVCGSIYLCGAVLRANAEDVR